MKRTVCAACWSLALIWGGTLQADGLWLGPNRYRAPDLLAIAAVLWCCATIAALRCRFEGSGWRWILLTIGCSELLGAPLSLLEARHYRAAGYAISPIALTWFVLAGGFWLLQAWRGEVYPVSISVLGVCTLVGNWVSSIAQFPVSILRSDMLPLIMVGNQRFLAGHDAYFLYSLPGEKLSLTYLPVTWLAYLPAAALHVDPRWVSLVSVCSLFWLVGFGMERYPPRRLPLVSNRGASSGLLMLALLVSPYVQYRHEIYVYPLWLLMAGAVLLIGRERWRWGALLLGLGAAASQFVWVMLPYFWLLVLRRRRERGALLCVVLTFVPAVVLIGPFLLVDRSAFLSGVFGHWQGALGVNARPANFSALVSATAGFAHLQQVQAGCWFALFGLCLARGGCKDPASWLRWSTVALLLFILLNPLVWGYFFLFVVLLVVLHAALTLERDQLPGTGAQKTILTVGPL